MGKRWKKYESGIYRLGSLRDRKGRDQAVVWWTDEDGPHRKRLDAYGETQGRAALDTFVSRLQTLMARESQKVGDIFDAYLIDREKDGKLIATFKDNWKALGPRFATMGVADVNADVCRDYADMRYNQGRSAGTIWTELTRLRSALNWAFKRNVIKIKPYVWVPMKPRPKQRVLTQEEIYRLYEKAVERHIKVFVALGIGTGARTEAILDLKWEWVDFDAATIDLQQKVIENPLTKRVRKGRAIVPMSDDLRAILRDAYDRRLTEYVVEYNGERVKKIRKGFMAAVARAGLGDDVTPHTLRHTVASAATDADIPMLKISRFLGHRDMRTTETIYAKSSAGSLKDVANVVRIRRRG